MAKKSGTTGPYAYISNTASTSVTVIDTSSPSNPTVVGSIRTGSTQNGLVLSPKEDFLYVANADSHSVSVIDTSTNEVRDDIPVGKNVGLCPTSMAISADGSTVYAGLLYPNNYLSFRTGDAVCAINPVTKNVKWIDVSFGGRPLDNDVNHWPTLEGGCGDVGTLAMRPGHPELYVPIQYANKIAVIDTSSNCTSSKCVIRTIQTGSGPGLAFADNKGKQFYEVCTYNLGFAVFDASTGSMLSKTNIPGTPEVVAVSPNFGRVYVLCVDSSTVAVIDTAKPDYPVNHTVAIPFHPSALAFTQDSAYAYVVGGGDYAQLIVIDANLNQVVDPNHPIKLPGAGPGGIVIGTKTR